MANTTNKYEEYLKQLEIKDTPANTETSVNKSIYDNYNTTVQNAKNVYDKSISNAQESLYNTQQNLDILNQRLAKYIPTINKAQGINGGMAQSAMVQANANVQNTMAQANADFANTKTNLYENYMNALTNAEIDKNNSIQNANATNISNFQISSEDILSNNALTSQQKGQALVDLWNQYSKGNAFGDEKTNQQTYLNSLLETLANDYTSKYSADTETGKVIDKASGKEINVDTNATQYDLKGITDTNSLVDEISKGLPSDSYQKDYTAALKTMISKGLQEGDIINFNYGVDTNKKYYQVINGKLVKLTNVTDDQKRAAKVPEGYKVAGNNEIRKTTVKNEEKIVTQKGLNAGH